MTSRSTRASGDFARPRSTHDREPDPPIDAVPCTSRRVYVMDGDFGRGDDRVGWITVNLPKAYRDSARQFSYSFTGSGKRLTVYVEGTWID